MRKARALHDPETGPATRGDRRSQEGLPRELASVEQSLKRSLRQKVTEIDKSQLAGLAGCSRTFLYQNKDARKLIA